MFQRFFKEDTPWKSSTAARPDPARATSRSPASSRWRSTWTTRRRPQKKIIALEHYYEGGCWKKDFEDDEAGLLPSYLKRGVLTEDAIYDLLTDNDELLEIISMDQFEKLW